MLARPGFKDWCPTTPREPIALVLQERVNRVIGLALNSKHLKVRQGLLFSRLYLLNLLCRHLKAALIRHRTPDRALLLQRGSPHAPPTHSHPFIGATA